MRETVDWETPNKSAVTCWARLWRTITRTITTAWSTGISKSYRCSSGRAAWTWWTRLISSAVWAGLSPEVEWYGIGPSLGLMGSRQPRSNRTQGPLRYLPDLDPDQRRSRSGPHTLMATPEPLNNALSRRSELSPHGPHWPARATTRAKAERLE